MYREASSSGSPAAEVSWKECLLAESPSAFARVELLTTVETFTLEAFASLLGI
jgi:hypothetical protein